jgi:hypothetical protein
MAHRIITNAHLPSLKTLQKIVDKIMQLFGAEKIDWKKQWSRKVCSPVELDGQIDRWSCGLFVLMALRCFAIQIDYKKWCRNSLKERMSEKCLEALLAIPYVYSNREDNKSRANFRNSIRSLARTIELKVMGQPSEESPAEVTSISTPEIMKTSSRMAVNWNDNIIVNQSNNNAVASSSARSMSSLNMR